MQKIKFKIHPLFWILGVILIFFGEGYLFLVYIFTAVVHEFAHMITASFYKCRTNEIVLYPYGAVLYGEFSNLKPSEEAIVAISGPCFNLFVALIFTALWWLMPEIYVYTDTVVVTNISIALFNLLPVYPLDGGRILMSFLKIKTGIKRAYKIVKLLGMICCIAFFVLYILSIFSQINYTPAIISIFLFCSLTDSNNYTQNNSVVYPPNMLERGIEKKYIQVSYSITLLELLKLLSTEYYYVIEIIDNKNKLINIIEHRELENILIKNNINKKLKDIKNII